ncbi:MAG: protein kinase [Planctomycetaceae bacterium]|nr:protein kinase [Planctomycetaceae bacterium]
MRFSDPAFQPLTSDQLAIVDSICGRYEEHRLSGNPLSIETLVAEAEWKLREVLELELIRVELEIASRWDQRPHFSEVRRRFPRSAESIQTQWNDWSDLFADASQNHSGISSSASLPDEARRVTATILTGISETPVDGRAGFDNGTSSDGSDSKQPHSVTSTTRSADQDIQRFRILRQIAEGGIGVVYAAWDKDLEREVALKELKSSFVSRSEVVRRFLAEATITSQLEHPNIVPVYACGQRGDGRHYYAMRLIQGRSLQSSITELHRSATSRSAGSHGINFRSDPVARELLLRFITVCRAIGFAHSRGIIHRDLKPSNIMVGDFGETLVVDWGLARKHRTMAPGADAASDANLLSSPSLDSSGSGPISQPFDETRSGTIIGTPGYMSPEQARGLNDQIAPESDIYSLGATLFSVLTNAVPFDHSRREVATITAPKQAAGISLRHQTSPRQLNTAVPRALDAVCRKAMEVRAADRYSSAELMARDLESWLADERVSVDHESTADRLRRWLRQRPMFAGGLLGSLMIALVAMLITLTVVRTKNEQLTRAEEKERKAASEAREQARLAEISATQAQASARDAEEQRQHIQEILNAFITDVQRGLEQVPGSATVRKRVLTQVLIQLGKLTETVRGSAAGAQNSILAMSDLADVFVQFGDDDLGNAIVLWDEKPSSPIEAAEKLYNEAMRINEESLKTNPHDSSMRFQKATLLAKLTSLYRQSHRTSEAMAAALESAKICDELTKQQPDSVDFALRAAKSHDLLGQMHLQNERVAEARAEWELSVASLGRFAPTTNNVEVRRTLSICSSRFGDLAIREGDLKTAEVHYRDDLKFSEQLAKEFPENSQMQRDYATTCDRLGNIAQGNGQLEQALDWYGKARFIRTELQMADPSDFMARREAFVSCMKLGETKMSLQRIEEAKADFISADEHAKAMSEIDPKNTIGIRFRSFAAERLSDIALAENNNERALELAQLSLDISKKLAANDSENLEAARDVYLCHMKVGKAFFALGRTPEALAEFNLALNLTITANERNSTTQTIGDVVYVRAKIGETQQKTADFASAQKTLTEAIRLFETIPAENRSDADSQRRLVNLFTLQARSLVGLSKHEEARASLVQAHALAQSMITAGQRVDQMKLDLAEIEELLKVLDESGIDASKP